MINQRIDLIITNQNHITVFDPIIDHITGIMGRIMGHINGTIVTNLNTSAAKW